MRVIIEFDCDNAAFDFDNGGLAPEAARILRQLANQIEQHSVDLPDGPIIIWDANGNLVGGFRVENWEACTLREGGQ